MAKVTIDCETYLKLINGTASEGGTTSGGDYTSSDTSSGQSGSGGGSGKKTSGKNTGGKKNKPKSAIDFTCDNIFAYKLACQENKLDWRWLAAMDCGDKNFMHKGIATANLRSVVRKFVKNANEYQRLTLERYEWKNCYGFGAIAHIIELQQGGDSADAFRILSTIRHMGKATLEYLIRAMNGALGNEIIKTANDRIFFSKYRQTQREMFGIYARYVLQLYNVICKNYKKDHYCKPTILNWGTWDWKDGTFK